MDKEVLEIAIGEYEKNKDITMIIHMKDGQKYKFEDSIRTYVTYHDEFYIEYNTLFTGYAHEGYYVNTRFINIDDIVSVELFGGMSGNYIDYHKNGKYYC